MGLKSFIAKQFANYTYKKLQREAILADDCQEGIRKDIISKAQNTKFGRDHHFSEINSYDDFKKNVPIKDYEGMRPYVELLKNGDSDILWPGRPIYFAETSGTTSGVKYIPITKDSISNHISGARNALLAYIATSGNAQFTEGKMIFLSGSPILHNVNGIPTGRLSGIVNHHIPAYLTKNQVPSYDTNCIDDWETKLDKIVEETVNKNMTLISGIPPWMQMYFDKLIEKTGKPIKDVFPDFSVLVYGGVNFSPYRQKLYDSIGKEIDTIGLYPASEGFFAFQDQLNEESLLLNTNSGIFFEFIPADEVFNENPTRLQLSEVKIGVNYAIVINSNAGLWGYLIGDTIKFVSTNPYRILVTGRTKHFISAFGEHVIAEEVEHAMQYACQQTHANVVEFTVAPMVEQGEGKSFHEWFIEFEHEPENIQDFILKLEESLRKKNEYYDDLIKGNILQSLKITKVKSNGFIDYMKSIGKLGGQNKLPRLSNDRKIVDTLIQKNLTFK